MAPKSAGILMYRRRGPEEIEVLVVHPGGPFWAKRDEHAWSIPKGLYDETEHPLAAARREFTEETGCVPTGEFFELGSFRQPGGKTVVAWGTEGDLDLSSFKSNLFSMEWPPKSGQIREFPEADRAAWLAPRDALKKILRGQVPILEKLLDHLGIGSPAD
jgi:predicted NUDIX family NTP pyrophosphohydrolase